MFESSAEDARAQEGQRQKESCTTTTEIHNSSGFQVDSRTPKSVGLTRTKKTAPKRHKSMRFLTVFPATQHRHIERRALEKNTTKTGEKRKDDEERVRPRGPRHRRPAQIRLGRRNFGAHPRWAINSLCRSINDHLLLRKLYGANGQATSISRQPDSKFFIFFFSSSVSF